MIRSSTAKLPILIDRRRWRREVTGPQVIRASSAPLKRSPFRRSKMACRSWNLPAVRNVSRRGRRVCWRMMCWFCSMYSPSNVEARRSLWTT